jgi:hypothetical protein
MMLRYMTNFEIDSEDQPDYNLSEMPCSDERTLIDERREACLPKYTPKPISEDEDEDEDKENVSEGENEDDLTEFPLPSMSQRPQRDLKRRRDAGDYVYTKETRQCR